MTVGQDADRDDSGPAHESQPPVRRIDDDRWEASWDRFQAAHDDNDAALPAGDSAQDGIALQDGDTDVTAATNERPVVAPPHTAAPPADVAHPDVPPTDAPPVPAPPTVPTTGRADSRRQREETVLPIAPAPAPAARALPAAASTTIESPRPSGAFELTSQTLLRPSPPAPERGWRRALHTASRGTMNPGPSPQQRRRADIMSRLATPVQGSHRVAVVSLKGGVGKTTVAAGLALTLAQHRGDRVVALDANPDAGTLAERVTGEVEVSVRDLLADVDRIRSFTDITAYTSLTRRLQVVAADPVPDPSSPFDEFGYRTVSGVLSRFFNIIVTDSGTGVLHSALAGTLALADSLVVVGGPSVD
nr:AAA family ATPase [Geodermatophilaceae bacterium]